ncbi:uncharacterized protein LOC111700408 isoform X2 [Eurytemora carolleeae]|uniref:uncharacterized protein LOC111700408 isoform X2 n=1 Tax=Eurytemora carolleeae TaxID=1294199 RepID=UPI000C77E01A|nr:uncharacterized protein LOC111700408 isoform X2 [Eurytemora carolleeae]|eukprot:XP_023327062.1 uncharacterized protein LOC111700408 isoform X2 [Eurytemora affinis]
MKTGGILILIFIGTCSSLGLRNGRQAKVDVNAHHHGAFGSFVIGRCTGTTEGDLLYCKYSVDYDRDEDFIDIKKISCVRKKGCDREVGNYNKKQMVTNLFIQHCIEITHDFRNADSKDWSARFVM